jgi:alanyl-tRNA synthetase
VTCDIELSAAGLSPKKMAELEEAVAAEIRAARPVSARLVSAEAYGVEKVRSRGLPEGHSGDIRLVEIAGLDLNTCGGTHVRNTAELELVKLLGTEPIRGGPPVLVAGRRARQRMEAHETRNALLRARLGAPDDDLVAALTTKLEQLQTQDRRVRLLEEESAEALAQVLAQEVGPLVERHLPGKDAAFLHRTARTVITRAPALVVFLTGESDGKCAFVLAASATVDPGALGKAVAADLGGRGGGSGAFFQGVCPNLQHREAALTNLRAAVRV